MVRIRALFFLFFLSLLLLVFAESYAAGKRKADHAKSQSTQTMATARLTKEGQSRQGVASWYGPKFHGRRTASGEVYNQHKLTAAHRTLPLGTRLAVTNMKNGKSVEVRVNDRGPRVQRRLIDLSYGAARAIGLVKMGKAPVEVTVLDIPKQ